jgi:hypothetical protein
MLLKEQTITLSRRNKMSMEINAESTIANFVESMLPTFSDKKLGLHMIVKFSFNDYGKENEFGIVRKAWHKTYAVELLFIRSSNYTRVLGRFNDYSNKEFRNMKRGNNEVILKQYSDHDSCWRTDGFSEFFQCFLKAVESYENEMGLKFSNKNISQFNTFDMCGKPTYVEIENCECLDKNNRWTSDYKVKINRTLTIKEAANYMPEGK